MKTYVRCGTLFTGAEDEPRRDEVLVFDEPGRLLFSAPRRRRRLAPRVTG